MSSSSPTADLSVRLAWSDDVPAMAQVQLACWREAYAELIPAEVLDQLPTEAFEQTWQHAITRPSDARQRVLVALERATVRGLVATAPSTDGDADPIADGEIIEVAVSPEHRAQGHGSRLLHAAIDTLRSDGFVRATAWLATTADAARLFLTNQGFAPDGAHRQLDLHGDGSVIVKQVRLHTDLRHEPV